MLPRLLPTMEVNHLQARQAEALPLAQAPSAAIALQPEPYGSTQESPCQILRSRQALQMCCMHFQPVA